MKNFSLCDRICGLAGLLIAVLLVMLFIALPAVADPPWSVNVRVNNPAGWNLLPAIAIDDAGNAFAAWTSTRHYPNCSVYFSYRPVEGDWSPDIQINDVLKTSCSEVSSNITADEVGNAYAIWTDRHDDSVDLDIYFSYRPAGGDWGASELVNDTPLPPPVPFLNGISPPAIGVDGVGNAYAVWEDGRNDGYSNFDIYFSYRLVGGSWSPNERVNNDVGRAYQYWPDIAVDGAGNAYVVWIDERNDNGDIYFSYRPAGGSWSPNERINDDTGTASQGSPKIAVDGAGNAYVVWIDSRNGGNDIYFSYRPIGGSWSPNERVNDDSSSSASREVPAIAVDEAGNAYAMWTDYRNGDKDIYFSYRPIGGNWSPNERGNDDTGTAYQYYSDIAVDGTGNTYAVWGDYRNNTWDIYFSYRPRGTPTPPSGLIYIGPRYLPADTVMVGEADRRITMGDHVHLRLPFRNIGSQSLSNVTAEMLGGQWTGSSPGVSIYNGTTWANQQIVSLTPTVIGPGETGIADFWIYVTNPDPVNRHSLVGQTWLRVSTDAGQWMIGITLSPISFTISGNEALKSGSCLHNPRNFEIQKYAQYAAGAWTMNTPPTNASDPDTPDQTVRNLVGRVHGEFHYRDTQAVRVPDTTLLATRHGDIGSCRHYADLTTGLLRSLGLPGRYTMAILKESGLFGKTDGHAWVEAYLGEGGWRQADSTWNRVFDEGIYEARGYTVEEAWANRYPLSSASSWGGRQYWCISSCYEAPADCPSCLRESNKICILWPWEQPDLSCVEDVRSRYHNVGAGESTIAAASDEELLIHLQNHIFVTRTVPFTFTTGIVNSTTLPLNAITVTVAISEYVDSTAPLFDVTPTYQLAADVNPGQTVTMTWVVTPLVTGSGIPLRVAAEGDGFFDFAEQPLVVNEPGTLPDLSLNGICGLDTILPGQTITLTASVLDERLQPITDTATLVTAAISSTGGFSTSVSLPYCAACDAFEQTVNLPTTAPIGSYRVDFTAARPGYESAQSTVYFFVAPPLSVTLTTNRDTFNQGDVLTLTVGVLDRSTMVTEANVLAEIQTPEGVVTIPVPYDTDGNYVASLRPADLAPNLNGQVMPGTWQILAEADYNGSIGTAQKTVTVRASIYLPIVLKSYSGG